MTKQEAIILIKKTMPKGNNALELQLKEALQIAIKSLELQTPKKPNEHNFYDEPHYYLCSNCKNIIGYEQKYCEECGQLQGWSE